ncbi:MAG: alpha/beta fold hydrolase [Pseudomonadales bacterium]
MREQVIASASRVPYRRHALTELPRTIQDIAVLRASKRWLQKSPTGDGHAVMVIPGFMGSDSYNRPLRKYLQALGYMAVGWNQGTNLGPKPETVEDMLHRLEQLHQHSNGPISIIGHSLGGVYAREIARHYPEMVRQVITLGSPFGKGRDMPTPSGQLYRLLNPDRVEVEDKQHMHLAPPVPTTSIYSKADGVVSWGLSVQLDGHEKTENIEVRGSHCGLTLNSTVWHVLADRLAQPIKQWQAFERTGHRKVIFPTPLNV